MHSRRYPWTRFWHKSADEPASSSVDYLPEADEEWARLAYGQYRALAELAEVPCLVLLGAPGMGKSTAVEDEKARVNSDGQLSVVYDLKQYGSVDKLEHNIFEVSDGAAAREGKDIVLFLDSLDEGRVVVSGLVPQLGQMLCTRLRNPELRARVKIRITCRSGDWPPSFANDLQDAFGEGSVEVWHLAQLRRSDVETAARMNGIDATALCAEIDRAGVRALAAKPVTLELLLKIYCQNSRLPPRQVDLYSQGLHLLCEDPNTWRNEEAEEKHAGRLTPGQRLAISRRIAALSVFCGRLFVQRIAGRTAQPPGVLSLDDVCSVPAEEPDDGSWVTVDRSAVQEVLRTALFRGAGNGLMTWDHITYAEFLAADYLCRRDFTRKQLAGLLHAPADYGGRVAPQAREVAAWLVSLDADLGREMLHANPDILMRSDVIAEDEACKLQVAEKYLHLIAQGKIADEADQNLYLRLASPALAKVLRPYVDTAETPFDARRTALRIARATKCADLRSELISLVLDSRQTADLRQLGVDALASFAGGEDLIKLKSLLHEKDDELRCSVINVLWPEMISTADVLPSLTPPVDNYTGIYNIFIREDFVKQLPPPDLPLVLRWLTQVVSRYPKCQSSNDDEEHRLSDFIRLLTKLVECSIQNAFLPDVLNELSNLLTAIISNESWLYSSHLERDRLRALFADKEVRRQLALIFIRKNASQEDLSFDLSHSLHLVRAEDFDWFLEQIEFEEDPKVKKHLARCLVDIFDRFSEQQHSALYEAAKRHLEFNAFESCVQPFVDLDSNIARNLRRNYELELKNRNFKDPPVKQSLTAEEVRDATSAWLAALESGDSDAWLRLIHLLAHHPFREIQRRFYSSFDSLSGWPHLTVDQKHRITRAAVDFVENGSIEAGSWWLNPSTLDWRALAAYRSLVHLIEAVPEMLPRLPSEVWARWARVIVRHKMDDEDDLGFGAKLSARCYASAPDAFRDAARAVPDQSSS